MTDVIDRTGMPRAGRPTRGFRSDIQGLRAVAVGVVVLGHAGVPALAGGFIGVDVFFVISGFLITGHLLQSLRATGRIDLPRFYAARARRILPASLTVIALTAVGSLLFVPPLRVGTVLADAVASALSVPNIRFALEGTDYLAGSAPSPFQHFWSLGVEEQFYLLWPLVLVGVFFIARRSRFRMAVVIGIVVIGIVAIASFVACLLVARTSEPWAFFSLQTRAWELAVGALLAPAAPLFGRVPAVVARALTWVGLAAILVAALLVTGDNVWPGVATVVPVMGAALVIGFGGRDGGATGAGRNGDAITTGVKRSGHAIIASAALAGGAERLLRLRPLQWIGAISYSLYLVHWPILVLAEERASTWGGSLPLPVSLGLAIAAIPVAWLLYRFVETPFRFRSGEPRSHAGTIAVALVGTLALTGCLVGASAASALVPLQTDREGPATDVSALPAGTAFVPAGVAPDLSAARDDTGEIYQNGCQQNPGGSELITCSFGDTGSSTVIALFGDSHAGRWFPALEKAATDLGVRLDTYTKSGCRSQETEEAWNAPVNASCGRWREHALAALGTSHPDIIVVSNHLGPSAGKDPVIEQGRWERGIEIGLDRLPADSTVIMVADTPEFPASPVVCLSANLTAADRCSVKRDVAFNTSISAAQRTAAERTGNGFLDLTDYFCNSIDCPAVIGSTLVYGDEHHVTATWSSLLGPVLEERLAPYVERVRKGLGAGLGREGAVG